MYKIWGVESFAFGEEISEEGLLCVWLKILVQDSFLSNDILSCIWNLGQS